MIILKAIIVELVGKLVQNLYKVIADAIALKMEEMRLKKDIKKKVKGIMNEKNHKIRARRAADFLNS